MAARGYKLCRALLLTLSLFGILLSFYSYYVEMSKERDPNFKAACDLSEWMSCSKVFTSKYGRGFGIFGRLFGEKHFLNQPNSIFGMAFYTLQAFLSFQSTLDSAMAQVMFAVCANLMSVYLAYILYFVLEDFCVVCVTTYCINFFLLIAAFVKKSYVTKMAVKAYKVQEQKQH